MLLYWSHLKIQIIHLRKQVNSSTIQDLEHCPKLRSSSQEIDEQKLYDWKKIFFFFLFFQKNNKKLPFLTYILSLKRGINFSTSNFPFSVTISLIKRSNNSAAFLTD